MTNRDRNLLTDAINHLDSVLDLPCSDCGGPVTVEEYGCDGNLCNACSADAWDSAYDEGDA